MDIRSFFGGKKSGNQESSSGSSALSAIRKAAPSTPTSEHKKRSDKLVPNKSEQKTKKPKKAAVAVVDLSESDDYSDEDFIPKKASKGATKSVTPSPVKSPPKVKRSRIVVSDTDEDATPSPKKQQKGKEKTRAPAPESGDEEVSSTTDSENEFMEKKKPKKGTFSVQKKLGFDKDSKKATPAKGKVPPKDHEKKGLTAERSPVKPKLEKGEIFVPWVDKYKPRSVTQLVGQHGEKSPMNKLLGWLKDWGRNNLGEGGKTKKPKPPPFLAQTDGAPFKAVLLSGSPGVGKTTCAVMACENLGMKIVEMNASDVRSKKNLEQQITQLTESHQIEEYFATGESGNDDEVKHVLIMDEVDGMSGTEDRAGARMMSIACQEKLKISKEELDQMIELSGHDVRQSIYNLQLYSSSGGKTKVQKKDVAVAMIGCALPSIAVDAHLRAMIQFPAWLGKNSTANKRQRLLKQLATHTHLKISADNYSLVADYVPVLRDCLTKPLLERETDGVFEVVCTMNDYDLIREDAEAVSELAVWPGKIDPASKILPKVKAALTRALNKEYRTLPYATDDIGKTRRKAQQVEYELELDEEGNIIERIEGEESGFEDDSEDEDYKPGSKSKAKPKPTPTAGQSITDF
ncbi:replication factor RFC1 domain protein [Teladorsagia circumcincta]|uniref:Replication factor RFC1 domain protein n=1 Tax=Teladorsagia circumcincta TaxID=45464 RepID=A0A2G9V0T4_TELCI|nr:replication factor RFC1 domain protein [Teladorsagia circumcincta]